VPDAYRAPWWLPGGDAQTLYAFALGRRSSAAFARERWRAPDGDFIDVDRAVVPAPPGAPRLVLFHGLEGGSRSHYAGAFAREAARLGWRFAVPHFRGCSGAPNLLPRAYHSGDWPEIQWILRRFRGEDPAAPLYAVGVSLGGNALLRWLAEDERAAETVAAAAAVSAPMDLMAAGDALGRGFNLVYARAFLATMKPKALAMLERHPGLFDAARVRAARTLREFDDCVTAPLHGFRDVDDYWTRASAKPGLGRVRVPTLIVNARNDPFLPARALPDPRALPAAVRCEFPDQGGHVGFVTGPFPGRLDWIPRRVAEFFLGFQRCESGGAPPSADSTP